MLCGEIFRINGPRLGRVGMPEDIVENFAHGPVHSREKVRGILEMVAN